MNTEVTADQANTLTIYAYSFLAILVLQMVLLSRVDRAVVGSRQRYLWGTLRRIGSWVFRWFLFAAGFYYLVLEDAFIFFGVLNTVAFIGFTILEAFVDHDDWFTKQWKRIKGGAKRLLSALRPSPIHSPVSASS